MARGRGLTFPTSFELGEAMPKRLAYELIIAGGLILGSCTERLRSEASNAYDLADAAQANARTALVQNEEQDGAIDDLEEKVGDLEAKVAALQTALSENVEVANNNARLLDERWQAYLSHTH